MSGICKDLDELAPEARRRAEVFLGKLKEAKVDAAVVETLRTKEVQAAYYAQGRKPLAKVNELRREAGLWEIGEAEAKRVVTNTTVSNHESGRALDVVPLVDGKPSWNVSSELWLKMGAIGKKAGFVWGGNWEPFDKNGLGWDCPHYELPKSVLSD